MTHGVNHRRSNPVIGMKRAIQSEGIGRETKFNCLSFALAAGGALAEC